MKRGAYLDRLMPVSPFGFPNLWAKGSRADLKIARGDVGELARAMESFGKGMIARLAYGLANAGLRAVLT